MPTVDERYQAKLAARAAGTVPVFEQVIEAKNIKGDTQEAIDARYSAKIAARNRAPEAKPAGDVNADGAAPVAEPEAKKPAEPELQNTKSGKRG